MNLKFKVLSQRPLSVCGLDTPVPQVFSLIPCCILVFINLRNLHQYGHNNLFNFCLGIYKQLISLKPFIKHLCLEIKSG